MRRPIEIASVSRSISRSSVKPRIGLVRVGELRPRRPSSWAIALMRAAWNGSDTRTTSRIPRARRKRAAAVSRHALAAEVRR